MGGRDLCAGIVGLTAILLAWNAAGKVLPAAAAQVAAQTKPAQEPPDPADQPKDRPFDEFRIVPVRVHLLRDSETASAITKLTEKDIKRIFKKANGIWHAAGIHLWVESIVSEKPASTAGF